MEKTCTKCSSIKPLTDYAKCNRVRDGRKAECKACEKLYRQANKAKLTQYFKAYRQVPENRRKASEQGLVSYHKNKHRRFDIQYSIIRPKTTAERRADKAEWERNRRNLDIEFRLRQNVRTRLRIALRNQSIVSKGWLSKYLGCTYLELVHHIELQLTQEMTWENYGKVWHLDHRIPLSAGSLQDEEFCRAVLHYTNLQPMLAADNIKKANKIGAEYDNTKFCH